MPKPSVEQRTHNLTTILTEICQAVDFSYGEIWLVRGDNDFLELSPNYCVISDSHQLDLELFHECSKGFIMSKGEGLPGRVFQKRRSEWMLDVSIESESSFLRNKIAGICGVKTGFAIPIIKEERILMIMAFFTCDRRPNSPDCLTLAIDLATKLFAATNLDRNQIYGNF